MSFLTPTIAITGLGQAFGMGADLAALLAAIAVVTAGNPITETWSIGGSYNLGLLGGLITGSGGLSNTHNRYESDGSATRVSRISHILYGRC